MKNIAVLVSGGGTNLQALIDAQKDGTIKSGKITCVISSNPDAYALERARNNNIDTAVIRRKDFETFEEYDLALTELLKSKGADLVVLAGFMTILGHQVISEFENRMINIHPALIPSFCGEGYPLSRSYPCGHRRVPCFGSDGYGDSGHFVVGRTMRLECRFRRRPTYRHHETAVGKWCTRHDAGGDEELWS